MSGLNLHFIISVDTYKAAGLLEEFCENLGLPAVILPRDTEIKVFNLEEELIEAEKAKKNNNKHIKTLPGSARETEMIRFIRGGISTHKSIAKLAEATAEQYACNSASIRQLIKRYDGIYWRTKKQENGHYKIETL